MRKTDEKCPECGAALYLRSVNVGHGRRSINLECQHCDWREDPTIEGDDQ